MVSQHFGYGCCRSVLPGQSRKGHICVQAKVRNLGQTKAELSERVKTALLDRWEKLMAPETGCKTYEEFRSKVNSELKRPWLK